jgi:hypothetical protein
MWYQGYMFRLYWVILQALVACALLGSHNAQYVLYMGQRHEGLKMTQ